MRGVRRVAVLGATVLVFLGLLVIPGTTFGAQGTSVWLAGRVTDQAASPQVGSLVEVLGAGGTLAGSARADGSGRYAVELAPGTYDVRVKPPDGSGFGVALAPARAILADSELDFVLVPVGVALLSGRVLGGDGTPVAGLWVNLKPTGGAELPSVRTDADGHYAFSVTPGQYSVGINGEWVTGAAPHSFWLTECRFTLTGSTVMDLRLPVKRVDVHVEDPEGLAVVGVALTTQGMYSGNLSLGIPTGGYGYSYYYAWQPEYTDAAGNATLWVFPTTSAAGLYTITASPPEGNPYAPTSVQRVAVDQDVALTITLQDAAQLSGRVLGGDGTPVAGLWVTLKSTGGAELPSVRTDADGHYAFSVTPGQYSVGINGEWVTGAAPHSFWLTECRFTLTGSTVMDLRLPVKRVEVHVEDPEGLAVAGVALTTQGMYSGNLSLGIPTGGYGYSYYYAWQPEYTDAAGNATLWVFPTTSAAGLYTITASPPEGNPYAPTSVQRVAVDQDVALTITLQDAAQLSGRVLGGDGTPVAGLWVTLKSTGGAELPSVRTDANGHYAFSVTPGQYSVGINGEWVTGAAPHSFWLTECRFTLAGSTVMDLHLPVTRVDVHVQDLGSTPIANVALTTQGMYSGNLSLGIPTGGYGYSYYYAWQPEYTDAAGNATLWLFPTISASGLYTITASPPEGSPFSIFSVQKVEVVGDKEIFVVLQFAHEPPSTTALVSPPPDEDGLYMDPVTVTLDARPYSGYSIESTLYSVDGGPTQTYAGPFAVTGAGPHTVKYWSVDNAGVYEIAKTVQLEIVSDIVAPTTTAEVIPAPNQAGWNNSPVTVSLSALDNPGGTGVREVVYTLSGAQTSTETVIPGSATSFGVTADGTTVVSYFARDNAGNSETPKTLVVRLDATPPVVSVPADGVVEATSAAGAPVSFTVSATDALDPAVTATCSHESGTTFPLGTTTVTCSAKDAAGNVGTETFTVTVQDTTPPVITSAAPSLATLWPPNHQMVPIAVAVTANDLVSGAAACRIASVSSSEPIDGLGDGDTAPDWTDPAGLAVSLRSERGGTGNGRVYTLTVACQDAAGNEASARVLVQVPKSQGRK